MRFSALPTLFTSIITILSTTTSALPTADDDSLQSLLERRYHYLSARTCANPCGWSGQVCCGTGQTCTTNSAGQAACAGTSNQQVAAAPANGWEYYTTTYVETDLVTRVSTYSSFFGNEASTAAPAAIGGISCNTALGESPCGTLCCATGQYCAYAGQCAASNGQGASSSSAFTFESTTTAAVATNSAPVRPTSHAATTVTSTGSATTTVPYQTPTAASATAGTPGMTATMTNNGLSAGAIAGIVIGVLLGLFFLFLLCAFFCCKGIIDGILDFFGLRNRRRRETIIEERHAHHSSSGAPMRRTWYGASRPARPEKKSGIGGMTAVAGGLGTLAVILGLKRRRDERRDRREKTESEYSYDSNYYTGTSPSSASSDDRRTHRTGTRVTETRRVSSRSRRG